MHAGIPHPLPPGPGRHPSPPTRQAPPKTRHTPRQCMLGCHTPPPDQAVTPWEQAGTPQTGQAPPTKDQPPPPEQSILGDIVNERAVCILLEFNLVNKSVCDVANTETDTQCGRALSHSLINPFFLRHSLFILLHYLNTSRNEVVRSSVWKVNVSKGIVHFINLSKIKDAISTRICGFESHLCLYTYASIWIKWVNCHAGRQEPSRCHTRGESEESVTHRLQSTQVMGPLFALKPRADLSSSPKQGY